jgi:hypothetical protein
MHDDMPKLGYLCFDTPCIVHAFLEYQIQYTMQ